MAWDNLMIDSAIREALAEYAHTAWSGWIDYMFEQCAENEDGTLTIPSWGVKRWRQQAATPYYELPESEKQSDRKEADKILLAYEYATLR